MLIMISLNVSNSCGPQDGTSLLLLILKNHISAAKPLVSCLSFHVELFVFCIVDFMSVWRMAKLK